MNGQDNIVISEMDKAMLKSRFHPGMAVLNTCNENMAQ